jgi:phosphoribosylformylglycinamidine synthase
MSAKSGVGMRIDLDKVPTRQANMQPFEILLSESQERMLIVCHKGQEDKLKAVFDKWDLPCEEIGTVTDTGRIEFFHRGEKVADVEAHSLVLGGGAPVYERNYTKPAYLSEIDDFSLEQVPVPTDLLAAARKLWSSPNLASKRWIYEQYDSMVRTNSMHTNNPGDASLVRIKGSQKALALTVDCNPAYVYANPYKGAMIAVAEAARNISCTGATPLAITNCLNFGNPYNPEVYWQFVQAIKGMGEACRKFNTPVTGGNVSFYNQTVLQDKTEPVYPTPTIGMLGLLEDVSQQTGLGFRQTGHLIYMLGAPQDDLGSSEYLRVVHQIEHSPAPYFELEEEYQLQQLLRQLIRKGVVASAHDISEGGLFACLMEAAMVNTLGFSVSADDHFRPDAYLFGESQSRVVISVDPAKESELLVMLNITNMSFTYLGEVSGSHAIIDDKDFGPVADWKSIYHNTLSNFFEG